MVYDVVWLYRMIDLWVVNTGTHDDHTMQKFVATQR